RHVFLARPLALSLPTPAPTPLHTLSLHDALPIFLGGGVRGGRVYGRWPGLAHHQLFEGRDLAVTTDFRTLFSEIATRHLGVPSAPIFPGFRSAQPPLGILA